jgi:hypothetical protein
LRIVKSVNIIAQEWGYKPNFFARGLGFGTLFLCWGGDIAIILPEMANTLEIDSAGID